MSRTWQEWNAAAPTVLRSVQVRDDPSGRPASRATAATGAVELSGDALSPGLGRAAIANLPLATSWSA
jgi:hypothetical protein